eukprot:INCI4780.3.p1 GENE.INCI4780.3~~INCI4780.3.p1  ORF type:complete len:846 (+),score=129.67 INCI4780.3:511-3048(+)
MCAPSYKTYFFVLIGLYLCGVSLFLVYSSSHPDVVSVHSPGSAGAALDATKEQLAYSEQQASRDPLLLLKFRLARGEISSEEFQQMAGLLAVVDRAATALQSQKETRGGEGFNTDRQNVDAAAADGEKSSGTALGRSNSHVIPTTTPAIVAAAASEGNEVTVDILKSAPTNPMVVRGTAYDAHVTLYIEALGGALTPAGWSTRKIHGGDGKPFRFIPGKGLIEGWTLGVLKMHEGERAGLHVPSKLGYGASAQGSKGGAWYIPANSNLYFDIEVLESSSSDGQRGNEGGKIRRPSRHNAAGQNSQASGISAVSPAAKPKPSAHIPPMPIDDERAKAVRDGFRHAFGGYRAHAWGADEFKPQSGVGKATVWGGMGMMILDALDTCMVMGLDDEYAASVAWITENLDFGRVGKVSFFETTIRALGGLLGAFSLSGELEEVLLAKAQDLAKRLLKARAPGSAFATRYVDLSAGTALTPKTSLAEVGSCQLELRYLAKASNDASFSDMAHDGWERILSELDKHALVGVDVDAKSGRISGHTTMGGAADSFYEYLAKGWVQGAEKEPALLRAFLRAIIEAEQTLVHQGTGPKKLRYIAGTNHGSDMEHLSCFLPGALWLAAHNSIPPTLSETFEAAQCTQLAEDLMFTCWQMYDQTATGIGPEQVQFSQSRSLRSAVGLGGGKDFSVSKAMPWSTMRPEVVESLYVAFHLTGDTKYQDWGWKIYQAFEKHCRTTYGFGAHPDVDNAARNCCVGPDDRMESYALAETFKYLYLLFMPDFTLQHTRARYSYLKARSSVDVGAAPASEQMSSSLHAKYTQKDLDVFVFNTEAHPLWIGNGCSGSCQSPLEANF